MTCSYLSYFINNDTPQYGGAKAIDIQQGSSMSRGDSANSTLIQFPNHVGTHIDFPRHFGDHGKTLNDYEAGFWEFNKPCLIDYNAAEEEVIDQGVEIESIPADTDLLLIRTGFEQFRGQEKYWNNNPGLAPQLAEKLRNRCPELKAVGFDFISLSSYQHRPLGRESHKEFLLRQDILIIEDMALSHIRGKIKRVTALPLMIDQVDGGPITVIAWHE
jgi:kynurenine formamidase